MLNLLCLLALCTAPVAGAAQPIDRSNEGSTRRYVAERQAEYAKRADILRERGLLAELEAMRRLVAARMKPIQGQPGIEPATRVALNQVFAEQSALQLVELGRTVREVEALQKRGFDLVHLTSLGAPRESLLAPAAFAEDAVVGEIVAVDTKADLGDGRLTSVTFRAVETLAGRMKPEEHAVVRLASGCGADGQKCMSVSTEPDVRSLRPGDRYLLFLSSAAYAQQARIKGFEQPAGGRYALNVAELIKIEGERLHGTHSFPGGTLSGARAELAPFAKAQADLRRQSRESRASTGSARTDSGQARRRAVTK
jgi:hypothetical protein